MRTIKIGNKGVITLPAEVRREHGLEVGDILTLVDLGDGSLALSPIISEVARHGDRVAAIIAESNVTLEEMLKGLDAER